VPYVSFNDYCPDVAERETRRIILLENSNHSVPSGEYALLELYCDEPNCDCRRVLLNVGTSRMVGTSRKRAIEAVIAYGWETLEFYARWMKASDPEILKMLKGPVLNLGSSQSELAPAILNLVRESALAEPAYVQRLQTHYGMFRHRIDTLTQQKSDQSDSEEAGPLRSPSPFIRSSPKLGVNDPCLCGSGRKYKKCCREKEPPELGREDETSQWTRP